MKTTLSIIVPVYNTEKYLRKCIDSIISQSFTDWELILVDDGSTDSSPRICEEYAINDNRIKVIHQENKGVSSARNVGIKKACGEWLFFVDSDDYVINDSITSVIGYMDDEIDIIQHNVHYQSGSKDKSPYIQSLQDITREKYLNSHFHAALWHHFFKYDLIKKHNLLMDESLAYSEDGIFLAELILFANRVRLVPVTVYFFTEREGSATHDPEKYEIAAKGELDAGLSIIRFAKERQIDYSRISRFVTSMMIYHLYEVNLYCLDTQKTKEAFCKSVQEMKSLNYNYYFFKFLSFFYDIAVRKVECLFSLNYQIFKRLRKLHIQI